jgi:hypothetical protein
VAYEEYIRVNNESGRHASNWEDLSHIQRMGWEAAANAVAATVMPEEARQNSARAIAMSEKARGFF